MPNVTHPTTSENPEEATVVPTENFELRRCETKQRLRNVVLVSNEVMHYRVSVYNYFHRRFREAGVEFSVLTDRLQKENQNPPQFQIREMPFDFFAYRKAILAADPAAVILYLHLKDRILWPLVHWMKSARIPFAFWTKGGNWDAKESKIRHYMFNYVHAMSDGLILYAEACRQFVETRFHRKAFVANNTINFHDFPTIHKSKTDIKREFGIPFEKVVIFMGRMEVGLGRKRVDHLIDIFRGLDRSDIGLVLVGSGLSDELKARLNPRNTKYLGEVHDPQHVEISKLCKMADVCAIPGHVGLGLNQAFYWGLPVVTEEGDHPPELAYLKPGRNGFIVPRNDLDALRDRILSLLDDDQLRARFSACAREDILKEASIEGMFSAFNECVNHLIAGDRRRGMEAL